MQVRVNNTNLAVTSFNMFNSYSSLEEEDNEFVKNHFATDDNGNYYRGVSDSHSSHAGVLGHEPELIPYDLFEGNQQGTGRLDRSD